MLLEPFRALTSKQRRVFAACFLGWTLDAFDYFLLTYCLGSIATSFHVSLATAANSITWTLCMRPVGALLFGLLAERIGRRPTLMLNVVTFSIFEVASAFAPGFTSFLVLRALFGIGMGGEWGVGAALMLESLPAERRGFFSGLLQEGYVAGNLLVAVAYGLIFPHLHTHGFMTSWRLLFLLGAIPALLAGYIGFKVEESPAWEASRRTAKRGRRPFFGTEFRELRKSLPLFAFLGFLMFWFNSFSHGTQDLYPTFLARDHGFDPQRISVVAIVGTIGAFLGGICCGALSERWGRRRTIVVAALLAVPMIPLWLWSHTVVMLAVGGFLMQFMVQGAWGVIPVHLNELSPGTVRAVLPGFAYQIGNLLSSGNGHFQAEIAAKYFGGRLAPVMGWTVVVVAAFIAIVTWLGREAKGMEMSGEADSRG
ncbi:MAG TPA: MFS transporter [Acidobacteriaceae bacterium]|jgi:SHS family lactate transporter-like MFS transporter|nr:MFS transporter [Acidobacteriaceae bacterium]